MLPAPPAFSTLAFGYFDLMWFSTALPVCDKDIMNESLMSLSGCTKENIYLKREDKISLSYIVTTLPLISNNSSLTPWPTQAQYVFFSNGL